MRLSSLLVRKKRVRSGIDHIVGHIHHLPVFGCFDITQQGVYMDGSARPVRPVGKMVFAHGIGKRFMVQVVPVVVFDDIDMITIHLCNHILCRQGGAVVTDIAVPGEFDKGGGNVDRTGVFCKHLARFVHYLDPHQIAGEIRIRRRKKNLHFFALPGQEFRLEAAHLFFVMEEQRLQGEGFHRDICLFNFAGYRYGFFRGIQGFVASDDPKGELLLCGWCCLHFDFLRTSSHHERKEKACDGQDFDSICSHVADGSLFFYSWRGTPWGSCRSP